MVDVYEYVESTGTIVPDAATIQTNVQDEYKQAFGQDLVLSPSTPQGVLIVAETLARKAVADNNAALANQINPNLAGGIFLDAILALTGAQRTPAQYTTVSCNLTGVAGTIIPEGSQAVDPTTGNVFASVAAVTLATGTPGTATVDFKCVIPGAITVGANTITQVASAILGWETITNPAAESVLGSDVQSDAQARLYRRNTLALQGDALPYAIISALYSTPGVNSVLFRENIASTIQTIDGIAMMPHSIYACVDGGTDAAVANVLLNKKSGGCAYSNGASSNPIDVTVTVPSSGQVMHILFDRPDLIDVKIRVTIKADSSLQNPQDVVKAAVLAYANGELADESGFSVGTPVSPFEIAGAVNQAQPSIFVHKVEVAKVADAYSVNEIAISAWEKAQTQSSAILVVIT